MSAKSVLVTGATGFLGGTVCHWLSRCGWQVTATGRNDNKGLELARAGFDFRRVSLEDWADTAGLCDGHHAVVHCAALSSPWGRWQDFHAANVIATENLLRRAMESRVTRFIHISTPSIYFDFRHRLNLTENSPLPVRSANHYAATKLAAERIALTAAAAGLPVVVLRPRAIFGPGDTAIFPRLLRAAARNRLPIIGSGRNVADLTYIENAAHAVERALNAPDTCLGQVFNITDGEPVILWDFIRALLLKIAAPPSHKKLPLRIAMILAMLAEYVGRLSGREPSLTRYSVGVLSYSQTFDISKAKVMLGYRPNVTTNEGANRLASHLQQLSSGGV